MSVSPDLAARIERWLEQDPDEKTREMLRRLAEASATDAGAVAELEDAFGAELEFGTAGLRGPMGPGPNRMNRVTVARAAAGLARYLLATGKYGHRIVIGYDARHNSKRFAMDSAEILAGAGFVAELSEGPIPTPVLAYAIRRENACAGIVVTASHNPAADNGYKVYLADGRQIVPPMDTDIAAEIHKIDDIRALARSSAYVSLPDDIQTDYVARIAELLDRGPVPASLRQQLTWVYSAMHGVGWQTIEEVVRKTGFEDVHPVAAQRDPDPDFPTVSFPNPEERGALKIALAEAKSRNADILLANDPDADRLAVAVPDRDGSWLQLTGDQVGALLGWWIIERERRFGRSPQGSFGNSVVSSTLLGEIAKSAGLNFQATLTGFKWVSRVPNLIFGYEEAIGFCVDPESVGDKDGISAAAYVLELAAFLKDRGETVWTVLDQLAMQHGLYATRGVSIRVTSAGQIASAMASLRENQLSILGEFDVLRTDDLAQGYTDLPPTDGIMLTLGGNEDVSSGRIIVRPSGTEPKVKAYLQLVVPVKTTVPEAEAIAKTKLSTLATLLMGILTGS